MLINSLIHLNWGIRHKYSVFSTHTIQVCRLDHIGKPAKQTLHFTNYYNPHLLFATIFPFLHLLRFKSNATVYDDKLFVYGGYGNKWSDLSPPSKPEYFLDELLEYARADINWNWNSDVFLFAFFVQKNSALFVMSPWNNICLIGNAFQKVPENAS